MEKDKKIKEDNSKKEYNPNKQYNLIKKRYLTKIGIRIDFRHSEVFKISKPIDIPVDEEDNEMQSYIPFENRDKNMPYFVHDVNRKIDQFEIRRDANKLEVEIIKDL